MGSTPTTAAAENKERPMSLREQQRAMTRERIITALGELIETKHPLEVTMAAVAAQAGVSEPTIYRHFSTKRNLFAALGSELFTKMTVGVAPTSIDELVEFLPTLYESIAAIEATARWNLVAPRDQAVRPAATERIPMLREALGDALEDLTNAESEFLVRGLLLLTSPTPLLYWQDYLGITVDEAAATASWLIRRFAER